MEVSSGGRGWSKWALWCHDSSLGFMILLVALFYWP
uniref:Uncharacterized protein n=1 Tax=Arundo donax TaxID=35708 RepID=A0A0A8XU95_ARUDO